MSQYTQLPSHSTVGFAPYASDARSSSTASSLAHASPAALADSGTDSDEARDEKRLLAHDELDTERDERDEDADEMIRAQSTRAWTDRLPVRPRTLVLSLLSLSILVALFAFFHPRRESSSVPGVSHDSTEYYSGFPLEIGLYDPRVGHLSANPLPKDATFADVPFASIGHSWDESGRVPEWAGGDAGANSLEGKLNSQAGRFSNGTHWWDKTVILVIVQGMSSELLSNESTPELVDLAKHGMRAEYLEPVAPTLSAPNVWSILTGLNPSSHGIVSNKFHSFETKRTFDASRPEEGSMPSSSVWDPDWYHGEPIYQTALRSALKVATYAVPFVPPRLGRGRISRPTYWYPPTMSPVRTTRKLDKVLSFLDLGYEQRPRLILVGLDELECAIAGGGGKSKQRKGLEKIDHEFLGGLRNGLRERSVEGQVELVVVGDTGMKDVDQDHIVFLDEILGDQAIPRQEWEGGSPAIVGLRTDDPDSLLAKLVADSNDGHSGYKAYSRREVSQLWNFSDVDNQLVAPVWVVAQEGWTITTRTHYDAHRHKLDSTATNGYDSTDASMRSVFVSSGPLTESLVKSTRVVPGFSNVQVYDFIATALDIAVEDRALNNATLGFWDQLASLPAPAHSHPVSSFSSRLVTPTVRQARFNSKLVRDLHDHAHSLPTLLNHLALPGALTHLSLVGFSSQQHPHSTAPSHPSSTRFEPSPASSSPRSSPVHLANHSPARLPSIAFEPSSSERALESSADPRGQSLVAQRPPSVVRSASFGAYDSHSYRTHSSDHSSRALSPDSSPFSAPRGTTTSPAPVPTGSSSSASATQPLLAEIFSGRPRPHFRSSTSYSHAPSTSTSSTVDSRAFTSTSVHPSSSFTSAPPAETPSYFSAPTRPPILNRARSQSSAPTFDLPPYLANRTPSPNPAMSYGAPGSGSGLSQSYAADQHGWRPSNPTSTGGAPSNPFSASLPTTSAVGSPSFSSFTNGARDLSSSPSSRAIGTGYSPFARPSSSLAAAPPPVPSSSKPGAFLSQSFSTGWEDFERDREGRTRSRAGDTWGLSPNLSTTTRDLSNSSVTTTPSGLSPFTRDGSRLAGAPEDGTATDLSSSSLGTNADSTWGIPTGFGPGGVYKARRDYSLGAVGSGRKRSDSAWGATRERVLREQDEEDEASFAPPTKSGATSRRHSFAAFEGPFSGRATTTSHGFHLPQEVHEQVSRGSTTTGGGGGGFDTLSSTSSGLRMGGFGTSAIDDDDLAADLNSLHLSLDAHAKQQRSLSTSASALHVGSMPVDFPPVRSRRFDTSRSPPPPSTTTTITKGVAELKTPASPSFASHGMPNPPGSPRATAEPFTPSFVAPTPTPATGSTTTTTGISHLPPSSVASRFFQAPSPLPPTTTNAIATATPGNGASRFDFFGNMPTRPPPQQQQQTPYPPQPRFGGMPTLQQGYYNPNNGNQRGPPLAPQHHQQHPYQAQLQQQGQQHRAGPPPTLGSTFSPFAASPYPSPTPPPPPPPPPAMHPHMMNAPPASYFATPPPPLSSQQPGGGGGGGGGPPPSTGGTVATTTQSQGDMSLGRGVPLHAIPPDAPLCIVGFKAGRKDLFFCQDSSLQLEEGDLVIVEADRGRDVGKYLKKCSIDEVHKFQQHMVELALGQLANPASMSAMGFGPNAPLSTSHHHHSNSSGGGGGGGGGTTTGPAQLARMTKECQPKRIYAKAGPADTHALLAKAQDEVKALQLVRGKVAQKGLPMEILDAEWQWDRRKLTFYYTADQRVDFRELVRELFRIWKTRVWLCCLDQQQPGLDFV
ncbi:uncharacterized protein JCM15063_001613 [Sporobolomyces koalae]|uniref:uncharacterized protein n=1 Tax=Sporobolomyces koalae TaxID=500713 RepID=UPI00316B044A